MSDITDRLGNYPDISFIDNISLATLQRELLEDYVEKYKELTGKDNYVLSQSNPYRMILDTVSLQLYQALQYIDFTGKQGLLKYAHDEYLENLGAMKGIERMMGTPATATMRFTASKVMSTDITIPAGTRITAGDDVYFITIEDAVIKAGTTYVDTQAECSEIGAEYNKYTDNTINTLVDIISYVDSVRNITPASGGSDVETDDNLAERIFLARASFSIIGTEDEYISYTKSLDSEITDVTVSSPSEAMVEIRYITTSGIPNSSNIRKIQEKFDKRAEKNIGEQVTVKAPESVSYNINVSYSISSNDASLQTTLQENIREAVERFKEWQSGKIGRGINPSKLISFMIEAGANNVVVTAPAKQSITVSQCANCGSCSVNFTGVDND